MVNSIWTIESREYWTKEHDRDFGYRGNIAKIMFGLFKGFVDRKKIVALSFKVERWPGWQIVFITTWEQRRFDLCR